MSLPLSESAIVRVVAEKAARRVARKVIATLQGITETLSGDDSELKTAWDEICVQLQQEESLFWEFYDQTVRAVVSGEIANLPAYEKEAIWLQTDAGFDWSCEDEDKRASHPVADSDIIHSLTSEYIYAEAGRWSNSRIRAYIERSSTRD